MLSGPDSLVVSVHFCTCLINHCITGDFVLVGNYTGHNVWSIDGWAGYTVSWTLVSSLHNRCSSQLCWCRYLPEPQCFKPSSVTVCTVHCFKQHLVVLHVIELSGQLTVKSISLDNTNLWGWTLKFFLNSVFRTCRSIWCIFPPSCCLCIYLQFLNLFSCIEGKVR